MKKAIFLLFAAQALLADSSSIAIKPSELPKNYDVYLDVGAMYILPQVGAGFRQQNGYLGYDLMLKGSVLPVPVAAGPIGGGVGWFPWFSGGARFLYYPQPNLEGQWYMGAGATSPYFSEVCPSVVLGRSYQTAEHKDRFWQLSADILVSDEIVPLISFSYGICL